MKKVRLLYEEKDYFECSKVLYDNFWQGKFVCGGFIFLSLLLSLFSIYLSINSNNNVGAVGAAVGAVGAVGAVTGVATVAAVGAVGVVAGVAVGDKIYCYITLKLIRMIK